jgi:very-short-patch-repair endonuclease
LLDRRRRAYYFSHGSPQYGELPIAMTLHFNITPLKKRRRYLRNHLPKAEVLLWMRLSNRQVLGYKFRRQYSVDRFVIDFYCPELRLAIEVDGESHFTHTARVYDRCRQHHIESFGIKFLRVMNENVYGNLDAVLDEIETTIRGIEENV